MNPFPYKIYRLSDAGPMEFVTETGSRVGAEAIALDRTLIWAGVDKDLASKILNHHGKWIIKGPYDDEGNLISE